MIFKFMTIVSFLLSSFLSVKAIYSSILKVKLEVINLYKAPDIVYLKVLIHNSSTNYLAITNACLVNENSNDSFYAPYTSNLILKTEKKTNREVVQVKELFTEKIPVNIPPLKATSFFIAFPIPKEKINIFCQGTLKLELIINNKKIKTAFDFNEKNSPKEELMKELRK